eukprot:2660207-Pleurochrysis_carterae.AAC.1
MAMVVNLRAVAPRAHWAKVTDPAWVRWSASLIAGKTHRGAWDANLGHHAAPSGSPQSAGFSTAHTAPASPAACTRSAVKLASVLCLARYRTHRLGTGVTPSGDRRVRSCGTCATEKDSQGGAAKTA